jgi:hypothetical protein
MSTETIFIMIALMAVGFLARSLPEHVKEVAAAIGGLAAFLGIVLMVIGYFADMSTLTTIGMFLVAPALAAFLGTALLENTENAWNAGRSAGQPVPRKERGPENQATGVKFASVPIKAKPSKQSQATTSDAGVREAEKTVKENADKQSGK